MDYIFIFYLVSEFTRAEILGGCFAKDRVFKGTIWQRAICPTPATGLQVYSLEAGAKVGE